MARPLFRPRRHPVSLVAPIPRQLRPQRPKVRCREFPHCNWTRLRQGAPAERRNGTSVALGSLVHRLEMCAFCSISDRFVERLNVLGQQWKIPVHLFDDGCDLDRSLLA
jgi:hypothetical protein